MGKKRGKKGPKGVQGNRPPFMKDLRSDNRNLPPWIREPFPDEMWGPGGDMPPWMCGPCPEEEMMRDSFPGEISWGNGHPRMGGPFLEEMHGPRGYMGPAFPEMCGPRRNRGGPFPEEMCGPQKNMEGPFPEQMCEPWGNRGGPFPQQMCGPRGNMGGPFPKEMCGPQGNMFPQMEGPFSREMCSPGRGMHPQMRDFYQGGRLGPQVTMSPEVRGPCLDHSQKPGENMPLQKHGPNSSDPQPRPIAASREGVIRGPASSPGIRQQEINKRPSCSGNDSSPPGNSSGQLPSGGSEDCSMNDRNLDLQEGAGKILETFGLSSEDLNELCRYPADQLKPENMPAVLADLRKRKTAEKMKNCPAPSMMNDYFSVSPRLFPHVCSLCKIECRHFEGWSLHLSSTVHSKSCHLLRERYPHWNPEDSFWLQRYKSERNTNHARSSSHTRSRTRSRSRSPRLGKTTEPGPQHSRQQFSPSQAERSTAAALLNKKSKREGEWQRQDLLSHQEQPKGRAASQERHLCREMPEREEQPSSARLPSALLSSLMEKSVVQSRSLFQPVAAAGGDVGLAPGTSRALLSSVQLGPSVVSQDLLSIVQLVATQAVKAVLASREVSAGQAMSSGVSHVSLQPSYSASHKEEKKQEEKQAQVVFPSPVQDSEKPPSQGQRSTKESQRPTVDVPVMKAQGNEDGSAQSSSWAGCSVPTAAPERMDAPVRVWLVGHSYIFLAARHAAESSWGIHLGLHAVARLRWYGFYGMRWHELVPFLQSIEDSNPPDILVIHLGGNDLAKITGLSLKFSMYTDLDLIRQRWPQVRILWSEIIPRFNFQGANNPNGVERARRTVNRALARYLAKHDLGTSVRHPMISTQDAGLYHEDGVHLSSRGIGLFLAALQAGLVTELAVRGGR